MSTVRTFRVNEIVEWNRFPSSGSWYNARIAQHDSVRGYRVQVPGLDAIAEWVHPSQLRPRTQRLSRTRGGEESSARARGSGHSGGSRGITPGAGSGPAVAAAVRGLGGQRHGVAASDTTVEAVDAAQLRQCPAGEEGGGEEGGPVTEQDQGLPPMPAPRPGTAAGSAPTASPLARDQAKVNEALRSLKLGQRELLGRIDALERLCGQEREARLGATRELREQRQLLKQTQVAMAAEREESTAQRSKVSDLEVTVSEWMRAAPQLRRDVDEQRQAHDQFADALLEAVEDCVSQDALTAVEERIGKQMHECVRPPPRAQFALGCYWPYTATAPRVVGRGGTRGSPGCRGTGRFWERELGATASQAELQEHRQAVDQQLQRGMERLVRHVEEAAKDMGAEVERLEGTTASAKQTAVDLERQLEESEGKLSGQIEESEERLLGRLAPVRDRGLASHLPCGASCCFAALPPPEPEPEPEPEPSCSVWGVLSRGHRSLQHIRR
jgi:hypothetical protein